MISAAIYAVVMGLAAGERARAFKAVSPGMLPPLGILFALFSAFTASQVWNDTDRANTAVIREARSAGIGVLPVHEHRRQPVLQGELGKVLSVERTDGRRDQLNLHTREARRWRLRLRNGLILVSPPGTMFALASSFRPSALRG